MLGGWERLRANCEIIFYWCLYWLLLWLLIFRRRDTNIYNISLQDVARILCHIVKSCTYATKYWCFLDWWSPHVRVPFTLMIKSLIGGDVKYHFIILKNLHLCWGKCLAHQNKWLAANLLNERIQTIITITFANMVGVVFISLIFISTTCELGSFCCIMIFIQRILLRWYDLYLLAVFIWICLSLSIFSGAASSFD